MPSTQTITAQVIRYTYSRYFLPTVLLISCLLLAPSLNTGLQSDDWYHKLILSDRFFFDFEKIYDTGIFSFFNGDKNTISNYINAGILPWWTYEQLSIQFFRPISDLSHMLDYALWPNSPWIMHLENILLYAAILILCNKFYLKVSLSRPIAGLAILLFALDSHHGLTVSWIANRNALIAMVFALISLNYHHLARLNHSVISCLLSVTALLLCLLSAEYGITITAFLFSYQICLDKGPFVKRMLAIAPQTLLTLTWLLIYKACGFGEIGSGAYIDPFNAPLEFITTFIKQGYVLFAAQLSSIPTDFLALFPNKVIGLFSIACLVCFSIPLLNNKNLLFWMLSGFLAILPLTATLPSSRVLIVVSIAFYGFMSQLVSVLHTKEYLNTDTFIKMSLHRVICALTASVILINLLISPCFKVLSTQLMTLSMNPLVIEPAISMPLSQELENTNLVIINSPLASFAGFTNLYRAANDMPIYKNTWILASANENLQFNRTATNTFTLESPTNFVSHFYDAIYRSSDFPFSKGDEISLSAAKIKIISLNKKNLPNKIEIIFNTALDDKSLMFVYWDKNKYKQFSMPEINNSVQLDEDQRF